MLLGIALAAVIMPALLAGWLGFRTACLWGRYIDPLREDIYHKGIYARNGAVLYESSLRLAEYPAEDVEITSFDGLRLFARLLPLDNAKGTILLFHGFHSTPDADFGCAVPLLRDMGYQLLLVEERAHQRSEGKYLTFGVRERQDVLLWAREMERRMGKAHPLYLEGISMGASTVLMASALDLPASVCGIIADCGFTSPADIVAEVMKGMHVPKPAQYLAELWCRLLAHFSMWETSAPEALSKCKLPVLFIHGTADSFVPCRMTEENYAACASPKTLVLVEGAEHGESFLIDRPRCEKALREFLK